MTYNINSKHLIHVLLKMWSYYVFSPKMRFSTFSVNAFSPSDKFPATGKKDSFYTWPLPSPLR